LLTNAPDGGVEARAVAAATEEGLRLWHAYRDGVAERMALVREADGKPGQVREADGKPGQVPGTFTDRVHEEDRAQAPARSGTA